jgi:pimeloyl-ACP methyl ester carboxylesterase
MHDRFVEARDGIRLAVRDHGGDGRPLVLLHGAGTHLLSLEHLAAQLRDFRVVAMDARWSGWSGDSPTYDWDDLVRDVESVIAALSLDAPIVAGHSWGGMIAAFYGVAHPEAPGVINLDGHGSGNPSLYDGMTEAEATTALAMVDELSAAMVAATRTGDAEWYASALAEAVERCRLMRVPEDRLVEFAERGFVERSDGTWEARPSPVMYTGLRGDLGLLDVYRRVGCPLLILSCTRPQPGMPEPLDALMRAYRIGLGRSLDELALECANVEVERLDHVDHQSIVGRDAPEIAAVMRRFIEERCTPPQS